MKRRRGFAFALIGAAAVVGLAACGSTPAATPTPQAAAGYNA
jgi:hypothetical protein